jgi:predicted neuraminidase
MSLSSLPNNNSGTDALTLADGRHLLVYNHTETPPGKSSGPRSPLNVAVSADGEVWQAALLLENDPGEYSYPALIQTPDGLVHITYTWKRLRVKHVVLDPSKIIAKPFVEGQWPHSP